MIRAVVWKELREQGPIVALLAVLGGALLIAVATFADPPKPNAAPTDIIGALGAGRITALMLVVTAGMVCGGALFAAEKEAGTMAFLDTLPTARAALWRAKIVAGLVLAAAVVGALLAGTALLNLGEGLFLQRLVIYALLAFAWGTLGSTLARTTLGSVGVAVPCATLAAVTFLIPIYLFFSQPGYAAPRTAGWVLFEVLMVAAPLAMSAWRFTAPDRARSDTTGGTAPADAVATATRGPGLGLYALTWLALRQARLTVLVLSAFALVFGAVLQWPEWQRQVYQTAQLHLLPLYWWPPLALTLGVLTGVTVFGGEQIHRTAAFWGEYRLPIGRAWWVKVGVHLGLLAWLLILLALPSVLHAQIEPELRSGGYGRSVLAQAFRSRLFDELGPQGWKYLLLPAAYGFAFGHVCGLLFRKPVVACGVALMLGGAASIGWGPSLLSGGVRHWQVWLPAAAVLLTGRAIVRAWSADRLGAHGPVLRVVAGAAGAVAAFAVGLGYRAVEVPDDPTGGADVAFVEGLPAFDQNLAGRDFRTAAERFAGRAAALAQEPVRPGDKRRPPIHERLEQVTRAGWPDDDPELGEWLDRVYADTPPNAGDSAWPDLAAAAAARPVGVYESPALVNTAAATAAALDNAKRMSVAMLARAFQRLAAGDPAAFVPAFRTVAALARNLRNGGGHLALAAAVEVERLALVAADVWLDRLDGRSDLMVALARAAAETDDPAPFDPSPYLFSDRFVIRNIMQAPSQWLSTALDVRGREPERAAAEADLVALAWAVPWERERTRRLVGLAPAVGPQTSVGPSGINLAALVGGRPGAVLLVRGRTSGDVNDLDTQIRLARRATILKATVLAFQLEHDRAPADPMELVGGGYLSRLPEDPHARGRPWGYRVSVGEPLVGRARVAGIGQRPETAHVVPTRVGQVIVWSVGADGIDQGGKTPPGGPRAEDLVYLIPPVAEPR